MDYLSTLPQELFDRFAEHIGKDSTVALRLVNREARIKIDDAFGRYHFNMLNIMMFDEESLVRAEQIASHPQYSKHVRCILLFIDEVHSTWAPAELMSWLRTVGEDEDTCLRIGDTLNGFAKLHEGRQQLRETRRDLLLLSSTFSHLRRVRRDVGIVVFSNISGQYWDSGFSQFSLKTSRKYDYDDKQLSKVVPIGFWGHRPQLPSQLDYRSLAVVLDALSLSKLTVSSFSMDPFEETSEYWALATDCFSTRESLERFQDGFSNVAELDLVLWTPLDAQARSSLTFMQSLADNDHHFRLRIRMMHRVHGRRWAIADPGTNGHVAIVDLFRQTFPRLKVLELCSAAIHLEDLQAFVTRHPQLEEVVLEGGKVKGPEWVYDDDSSTKMTQLLGVVVRHYGCEGAQHLPFEQQWCY